MGGKGSTENIDFGSLDTGEAFKIGQMRCTHPILGNSPGALFPERPRAFIKFGPKEALFLPDGCIYFFDSGRKVERVRIEMKM